MLENWNPNFCIYFGSSLHVFSFSVLHNQRKEVDDRRKERLDIVLATPAVNYVAYVENNSQLTSTTSDHRQPDGKTLAILCRDRAQCVANYITVEVMNAVLGDLDLSFYGEINLRNKLSEACLTLPQQDVHGSFPSLWPSSCRVACFAGR